MANQSVLELAVGTGKWDAGLKKAVQSLNNFTQANGGLTQALNSESQKMQQFVSMMGNMESSAKTAKGQMNDYKSAIEQLTMQYNRLTGAQKETFGSSYTATIDQLKTKYQAVNKELQEMTRSLNEMPTPSIEGGGDSIFSKMGGKLGGAMSVFAGNLMTKATMEVANLGSEMAEMVKQGVEMAKAGEGIRIAFERLGNGQILDGLREATHGTVTDIELMKAAVKFNDFKLPIEELGTMLAFAQQKAKDTGQSVDYMVDSIVTGLGRKSLMILDNLGLSATEIKDKMAETGDMTKAVGAIIREQMQKAGDYVETAADRAAQANVDLQNKLEELGRKFLPVQEASNQLWTSMKIGILDIVGGPLARLLNGLTEAGRLRNQMNDMAGGNSSSETEKQLNFLRKTSPANRQQRYDKQLGIYTQQENAAWREVNSLKGQRESFRKERLKSGARDDDWTVYADFDKKIAEAERKAKAWQNFRADYIRGAKELIKPVEVDIKTDNAVKGVDSLRVKLAELEAQRKKAIKAGDQDLAKNLTKQITQTKSDIKALDPKALTTTHTLTKPEQADAKYVYVPAEGSIDAQVEKVRELTKQWSAATDQAGRDGYKKQLDEAQGILDQMRGKVKTMTQEMATGISGLTPDMIKWGENDIKQQMQSVEYGTQEYNDLAQRLIDYNSVSSLMQEAVKTGLEVDDSVKEYFVDALTGPLGEKIPQELYDSLVESLNEFKEYTGDNPIELDAKTGNVNEKKTEKKEDDTLKETQKVVSGLSQVASGLQAMGIILPSEVTKVLSMLQGAMTVVNGVSTVISAFGSTAEAANTAAVGANTGALIANTSAMISLEAALYANTAASWIPFAEGGVVPKFSEGGVIPRMIGKAADGMLIPGNSYSGDRLRMPVDGGRGVIGVNSGELILNMSSQDNLAGMFKSAESLVGTIRDESMALGLSQVGILTDALDNEGSAVSSTPYVTGEQIFLGLNNFTKANGYGEIVTSRR